MDENYCSDKYGPYSSTAYCIMEEIRIWWFPYVLWFFIAVYFVILAIFAVCDWKRFCCCQFQGCEGCCATTFGGMNAVFSHQHTFGFISFPYNVCTLGLAVADCFFLCFYYEKYAIPLAKALVSIIVYIVSVWYRKFINTKNGKLYKRQINILTIIQTTSMMVYSVAQVILAVLVVNSLPYMLAHHPYLLFNLELLFFQLIISFVPRIILIIDKDCLKASGDLLPIQNLIQQLERKKPQQPQKDIEMQIGISEFL